MNRVIYVKQPAQALSLFAVIHKHKRERKYHHPLKIYPQKRIGKASCRIHPHSGNAQRIYRQRKQINQLAWQPAPLQEIEKMYSDLRHKYKEIQSAVCRIPHRQPLFIFTAEAVRTAGPSLCHKEPSRVNTILSQSLSMGIRFISMPAAMIGSLTSTVYESTASIN